MYISNDPVTKEKRRLLRGNVTNAEKILWRKLKKKQLGFQFRRQFGIENFILDFYCPEKKLGVELDGSFHRKRKEYDKNRTEFLNKLGIDVLRYWNEEVINDIDRVLEEIRRVLV